MQYKIFGCKTNKYYTEKWLNTEFMKNKTGIFVASCIVTDNAKSKWIKFIIDKINNFENLEDKIYLSGCWPIKLGKLREDFFLNYKELESYKDKIILLWEDPTKEWFTNKIAELKKSNLTTRKYIIIQNGCDNYCTFCTTIQARWWHKSRSLDEIIEELTIVDKSWFKEIIITGTNIWAWWCINTKDFSGSKFDKLIDTILTKTSIPRIRISSLWIEYLSDNLIELFKNTRIYPHFHLSIQSGSSKILKLMNRNYNKTFLEEKLNKIRNLEREDGILISIGADFIVGFPWEEDKDFQDTLEIIKNYKITKIHAFPFSIHKNHDNIPASNFKNQIDEKIKKSRMRKIIEIWDEIRNEFINENKWKILNLLVEKLDSNWNFSWWSENYIALNKENFIIEKWQELKNGRIIKGKFI